MDELDSMAFVLSSEWVELVASRAHDVYVLHPHIDGLACAHLWSNVHADMCYLSEEDGSTAEGKDKFDTDSDLASATPSRKRSSMVERESFSELPEMPEDLSKCLWPIWDPVDHMRTIHT